MNLIVTNAINNLTLNSIEKYSSKINVPFKVVSNKFEIFNSFKNVNKILYLNDNILIRDDCPNLFDETDDKLTLLLESKFINSSKNFYEGINHYDEYKNLNWKGHWYNTDVMIIPKRFRYIFKSPHFFSEENLPDEKFIINLRIISEKIEVEHLHYNFNRIYFMDEKLGLVRHDGYVLNYTEAPPQMLIPKMIEDINVWADEYQKSGNYDEFKKRNIVIVTTGGMGDQICSEPVIRYMKNNIFVNDYITVVSHWPRLFKDIEDIKVIARENYELQNRATLVLYANPDEQDSEHHLSHVFFHPTDFSAFSLIKKSMPIEDRKIGLKANVEDFVDLFDFCDINDLDKLILIHPGKWWESKTFPIEWWQELINKLDESGFRVGLIGKTIDEKQGYLPVECPPNGIDFRDMISLDSLIALISQAKILITNDSSPIHIAGAFDNWIVTFSTAKASYNILPYRNGSQYYKALSLEKKLLIDDLNLLWLDHKPQTIAEMPKGKNWSDYLPEPDEVLEKIKEIY